MRLARRFLLALFVAQFAVVIPTAMAQAPATAPQNPKPASAIQSTLSDRIVA